MISVIIGRKTTLNVTRNINFMKRLIFTAALLLSVWSLSFAQSNTEEKIKQELADLSKKLALTASQQTEVLQIVSVGQQTKETTREDPTLSPEVLAESLNEIQAKTDAQVAEKLSDKQKMIFDKHVSERPKETIPMPVQTSAQPVQPDPDHNSSAW